MAEAPVPLASTDELGDWLGEAITDPSDLSRAGLVLRFASALVRRETGKSWLDESGELVNDLPDAVAMVTLASAGRAYTNPSGWTEEQIDDWRGRRDSDAESGVYLTASEKSLLAEYSGSAYAGLGTVPTERGDIPCGGLGIFGEERLLPPWY